MQGVCVSDGIFLKDNGERIIPQYTEPFGIFGFASRIVQGAQLARRDK